MNLNRIGVDLDDPVLANLQGNILKSHGRDYSCLLFLQFTAEPARVRAWMKDVASSITSARKQLEEAQAFSASFKVGDVFVNFFLTAAGYRGALDLKDPFPEQSSYGISARFDKGMKAAAEELGDPAVRWEPPYDAEIHALILLADNAAAGDAPEDLPRRLQQARADLRARCKQVATVVGEEEGRTLRNAAGDRIEHFGFADGRSQPLFFTADILNEERSTWKPEAPPGLVLVRDPWASGVDCFGSYLVFRKLEQRVASFLATEQKLADALGLQGTDRARAGAMTVGRFRDGTPLALCPAPPPGNVKARSFNDFNYFKEAETGAGCPLHAHIRRLNPRTTSQVAMAGERSHRIVRRSIPYGRRQGQDENPPALRDAPATGVGILFMCFQANIADQFSFLQKVWANDTQKPEETRDGIDPLIGQAGGRPAKQLWSPRRCAKPNTAFDFAGHVVLKGGEFFFAPSIPFLQNPPGE